MVQTEEFSLKRFGGDEQRTAAVYEGVDPLVADDVAEAVVWAASRPAHVNIDLVQLTPQQQAGVSKVVRRP
jgi:NADP-dependent 3-hydroxy acid dehydrogenase YdfG